MKTAFAGKGIMALIFTFLCSFAVSAVTPKDYLYDTKVRYEFQYNSEGKVSEKTAYRWNGSKDEWTPFYQIHYQYVEDGQIKTHYGMWDAKKKAYTLNVQEMVIPSDNYEEIFS